MRTKVVFTVTGSSSDAKQTKGGEKVLAQALSEDRIQGLHFAGREVEGLGRVDEVRHVDLSCHRHPTVLISLLDTLAEVARNSPDTDFILVMGAGWAAALPGWTAGYLYRGLGLTNVFVIGVALEDLSEKIRNISPDNAVQLFRTSMPKTILDALTPKQRRDLAAMLSITELPGGGRVTRQDEEGVFFGANGFERACVFAIGWEIPEDDELRKPPEPLPEKKQPGLRSWVAV